MKVNLIGYKVIVKGKNATKLYNKNFGSIKKDTLFLDPFETLFLLEKGKIEIYEENKKVSKEKLIKKFVKKDKDFLKKYFAFRKLREKGYIVKSALKYGCHFRIYEPGKYKKEHSKWLALCLSEEEKIKVTDLVSKGRIANSVRKKLLLAIVDNENDVTFYEVSWVKI